MAKSGKGSSRVGKNINGLIVKSKSKFKTYKHLSDVDSAHKHTSDRWENSLSSEERKGLYQYTTENRSRSYRVTNPEMRKKEHADMTTEEIIKNIENKGYVDSSNLKDIKAQYSALSRGVVPEAFVGYRGAGYSLLDAHLKGSRDYASLKALEGKTVRDTGAMSISMVPNRQFSGDVLYVVQVPKGQGVGANVMGVSAMHKSEAEFLVNYGTYYRINKVSRYNGPGGYEYIILITAVGRK